MNFERLSALIEEKSNPTVIGLDPLLEYIPAHLREGVSVCDALFAFNKALIDATADIIPAVKPQSAFYELYGLEGLTALHKTIEYAHNAGMFVILDAKRGDIGSTASAYAQAYLGDPEIDCITVNPYLGADGIKPFIDVAKREDKTIFTLVKTSNPSSAEFQDKILADSGKPLYRIVGETVEDWGADNIDGYGYSRVGAVVGATYPSQLSELRDALPHTFFLIPGYGAQGGKACDVALAFDKNKRGAIVNSSRGLMCAYKNKGDDKNFASFTRAAAMEMRDALNDALK